jgi:hypothetical protein
LRAPTSATKSAISRHRRLTRSPRRRVRVAWEGR